jgi:hypothetical protein
MDPTGRVFDILHWYIKDGAAIFVGKLIGSILTVIGGYDLIFGTHYLVLIIVIGIFLVGFIVVSFGSLGVKALDMMGVINLTSEQETVRRAFGLVTSGVQDWIELLVDFVTGK